MIIYMISQVELLDDCKYDIFSCIILGLKRSLFYVKFSEVNNCGFSLRKFVRFCLNLGCILLY